MTDFPTVTPNMFTRRRVLEAVPATALATGTIGLSDVVRVDADEADLVAFVALAEARVDVEAFDVGDFHWAGLRLKWAG